MKRINLKINKFPEAVLIAPTRSIVNEIEDDVYYIICTDNDKYDYLNMRENVLILHFADTEIDSRWDAFTEGHANAGIDFLNAHDIGDLFVTCEAGESRSAAIAAAIISCTGSDEYIWNSPDYSPNKLVYTTMQKCIAG